MLFQSMDDAMGAEQTQLFFNHLKKCVDDAEPGQVPSDNAWSAAVRARTEKFVIRTETWAPVFVDLATDHGGAPYPSLPRDAAVIP